MFSFEWRSNTEHTSLSKRRRGQHLIKAQKQILTNILRDYNPYKSIIMKEYKFSRLVFQSLLSGSFYTNERSQKSKYLDEKEAEFPEQVVKVIEKIC